MVLSVEELALRTDKQLAAERAKFDSKDDAREERLLVDAYLRDERQDCRKHIEACERSRELAKDFVAAVAHDLRAPLGAISMSSEVLLGNGGIDPRPYASIIQRNVAAALELVDTLLDVDSIESGRVKLRVEPVDLVTAVKDTVYTFSMVYERKGVKLDCKLPDTPVVAHVDKPRFGQVLSNLLANALKFTTQGTVQVELRDQEGGIELIVKDTGTGIPEDEVDAVFDKYSQAGNYARTQGVGLGLYIAKWVVGAHEGKIWAEKHCKQGSVFHVTLPKNPSCSLQ